jgi:hypothetical protein
MKGKVISVLFCLMLVFGMLLASCDDGAMPKDDSSSDGKTKILDVTMHGQGAAAVNKKITPSLKDLSGGDDGGDEGDE